MLKRDWNEHRLHHMRHSRSEVIRQTQRKLETKGVVMPLYGIVQRLGADTKEAILLLLDLLDLKRSHERRLSYLQIRATDTRDGRFKNKY